MWAIVASACRNDKTRVSISDSLTAWLAFRLRDRHSDRLSMDIQT